MNKLHVGDILVRFGRPYKIQKIKKGKKDDSETLVMKPCFTRSNSPLTYSIPVKSISDACIRKIQTKQKIKKLLQSLQKQPKSTNKMNTQVVKSIVQKDDMKESIQTIKRLWFEKHSPEHKFSITKRNALKKLMRRFVEEVAVVMGTPLQETRKKIEQSLQLCVTSLQDNQNQST